MASQIQDLVMRLRMEVGDSQRQVANLNAEIDNLKKGFAEGKTQSQEFSNSLTELNSGMELGKTIGNALSQALLTIPASLEWGQKIDGVASGFERLQEEAGLFANDTLAALRSATKGTVDDFTLMQQANQAVQLGLDPTKLDEMASAATKLGATVGRTASESFADLITGVGRASTEILDNLGITLKAEEAYEIYAAKLGKTKDKLTQLEKTEAFRVAALEKITEKSKELNDVNETAGLAYEQLKTSLANVGIEIAQSINANGDLAKVISEIASAINSIDFGFFERGIGAIAKAAGSAIGVLDNFVTGLTLTPDLKRLNQISDRLGTLKGRDSSLAAGALGLLSEGQTASARAAETKALEAEQRAIRDVMLQREMAISREKQEQAEYRELERELRAYGKTQEVAAKVTETSAEKTKKAKSEAAKYKKELKDTYDWIVSSTNALADPFVFDSKERATGYKNSLKEEERARIESYQNSVEVYGNLLSAAIDGDVKDTLTSMLEDSAVKFGSNLAAGLINSLTGINIADLFDFSSLVPGIVGNLKGVSGGELAGIGAAVGVTANSGLNFFKDVKNGKNASLFDSGVLAPVTGGFSLLGPFAGSLFGGGSDPFKERRDALREQLRESNVTDENNEFPLFGGGKGSLTPGTKFNGTDAGAEEFVGLGNLLSILQTGGVEEDLSSLFANALEDADSYNAALLTTSGLLERMGYDAETVESAIVQAYASGEISIEEFNAAMEQSRQLVTDDLESIDDAVLLLTDSFDGPARDSVKALELTFKEFRDAGIQDSEAMFAVIKEKFGEQAVPIFERLKAKGIDQFTDFSTLTNDQLGYIFNELIQLEIAVGKFGGAAEDAGRKAESGLDPLTKKLGRIKSDADDARAAVRRIGEA